ncbi:hypothetical protein DMN91_004457 [Ooceraea biroi]|uniref:Uncharacterized protein n=1 Tax=Ooceraea biroi TaxID=2015173 RepID=A0A3L8DVA4_OOCBI|nr:uncharacterized protein LOC105286381 isoform X1 [Ooceraea biroi]RLU24246.1 hypothetical protein DMN91_004457 [Ooceraea biroi]
MASIYKILVVPAILLASLSLSLAIVEQDIPKNFEDLNHDVQQFPRERRQEEIEDFVKETDNPVKLEDKFLESQTIHDREINGEAIGQKAEREDKKREDAFHTNNDAATDAENDIFSYKNMHDLIQAFILADKENKLQQEVENSTESETHNNLPKRHVVASASAAAAASSGLLGVNPWEVVPVTDLDAHSCGVEAFEFGHVHLSGVIVHEFFCELRKLWHYVRIILRNLKSELTLGPLVAEDTIATSHTTLFGHFFHHSPRFLQAIIRAPHHLLLLPEILRDAIPFPSITSAIHRFVHIFFKLVHFVRDLLYGHIRHVLRHVFSHHHLGIRLLEKLHGLKLAKGFDSILPIEEIVTEPIVSTATATATATTYQEPVVSDYHKSLAEVLTSFRGAHDGYYASGLPDLIRTGAKSLSLTTVVSKIGPYLPKIPLRSYFGCEQPVLAEDTTVSTSASASASVSSVPLISPTIAPIVSAPVAPVETISSSASASAAAVVATEPIISSTPFVPSYTPVIEPMLTVPPVVVSDTVSDCASSSSSVAIAAPGVTVPNTLGSVATAAAASAASASTLNVAPTPIISPRRYRPRPILPTIIPTVESVSSSSASASASDVLVEPSQNIRFDRLKNLLSRPRVLPSSVAASAAAAASAAGGVSSSSAASSSAGGISPYLNDFNLVFPREKIINALGYDRLLPGDIVTLTLKNKSTLFGRVFDATSPIAFNFLRPKLHASIIRNGRRIWNLFPGDFRDPECVRTLNNPLLLRHVY